MYIGLPSEGQSCDRCGAEGSVPTSELEAISNSAIQVHGSFEILGIRKSKQFLEKKDPGESVKPPSKPKKSKRSREQEEEDKPTGPPKKENKKDKKEKKRKTAK